MRKTIVKSAICLFLGILIISCNKSDNKLSPSEQQEGWKLLFDGKTLNGWRDYKGEGVKGPWTVESGTLTSLGQGSDSTGYLVTEEEYENFILDFDWKISEGGNSGIFYHVLERQLFDVPYLSGPEYQVIDDIGFPEKLEDWQSVGADYAMYAPQKDKEIVKKAGKWNSSRIVFDNGHVEHWLNGQKVVEFEAWSDEWFERKAGSKFADASEYGLARSGQFSLQDHGSRVWYKNIKLKELPRKLKEEVLFNGKDLTGWDVYGTELWYTEDGELICESGPDEQYGYLGTRKYYDDFDLTLKFKQISDGNSGVFIRTFILEGTKIAENGWQVEVAPAGKHTGAIYESGVGGRQWLNSLTEEQEKALKMGEWNDLRIRLVGDKLTTWLNGQVMTDFNDESIGQGKGRIMLQIHSGGGIKVRWKDMILKEVASQ